MLGPTSKRSKWKAKHWIMKKYLHISSSKILISVILAIATTVAAQKLLIPFMQVKNVDKFIYVSKGKAYKKKLRDSP